MPPFADDAGMLDAHVDATRHVAVTNNAFIFIRPTTMDAKRLIEYGYSTKSMDIHHKSSDWGPMAGFVPVNHALDKKRGAAPNRPAVAMPDPAHDDHGDEHHA